MGRQMGRHGLGPHVVGTRVVVRRLVRGETGPSGGPAMTDVLGTCLAWEDGVCVVAPDRGAGVDPVRIEVSDIVSGKPVPPRPSVRHRITPAQAQRRATCLFSALETQPLGDWLLRHSAAHDARRANSVLAMDPPPAPRSAAEKAVEEVLAFYRDRGRPAIAAVLPDSDPERLFLDRGWVAESADADTVFRIAGLAQVRRALRGRSVPDIDVELTEDGGVVTARIGTVATGVGVVDGDWAGFRAIAVRPDHRRQGLGLAVMASLLDWVSERGAATAYLQVRGDNEAALALYGSLGFSAHHTYRYLTPHPEDR